MTGSELLRQTADGGEGTSGRDPVRVFVLVAIRLYRDGIVDALAGEGRYRVVGAGPVTAEVFRRVTEVEPDVVVLDSTVDGLLALLHDLRTRVPATRVVVLGVDDADDDVLRLVEAGIGGWIGVAGSIADLRETISAAAAGEAVCSPRLTATLLERVAALAAERRLPAQPPELTARQRQIAALIVEGLSNKEIARRLSIETTTVKNHVHAIFERLQVSRRAEAVARLRQSRA